MKRLMKYILINLLFVLGFHLLYELVDDERIMHVLGYSFICTVIYASRDRDNNEKEEE